MKSPVTAIRLLAAALGVGIGAVSLVPLLAAPASAATPTGGCWVWFAGTPQSNISTGLAPWTDPAPADYAMTLSPTSPHPGDTVTISLTYNRGPKNGGPGADLVGEFDFDVNGETVHANKSYGTVPGGEIVPGATVTAQFVAEDGANDVVFDGVTFTATRFNIKIDCNGQSSGAAAGNNPRTAPLPTNITASVTASGDPVEPSLTASPTASPSTSPSTSPTASTSSSATSSPSSSSTASAGKAATGKTTFACMLNPLSSDFDYPVTVSVSGYREKAGDPVSLVATMTKLPGIAPLPIDAGMNVTLGVKVGAKKATLKGSSKVNVATKAAVPVPNLTGEIVSDADTLPVAVTSFTFDFPDMDIDADCTAPGGSASMGTMTVGTEPVDVGDDDGGGDSSSSSGSGGTLPKTGGGVSFPVLGLLAGALLLIGSGVLTLLPTARPYRRQH